ncbi:MAG: radical SAM protein, partial [Victivallales bacterium]|nr:radical SAM protein [Victivallales bacterium]
MRRDFHNLYIHVPFCASKCGYCAFYSIPNPADEAVEAWLERLSAEFAKFAENTSELKSVFIGGGTPTLLSNDRLERLFKTISANFAVRTDAEISIECNPETLTTTKADVIAEFANRVS